MKNTVTENEKQKINLREYVTLKRSLFYSILDIRPVSIQAEVLILTLKSLFEGHLPDTSNCSDEVHNAIVGLHYELSKIQKQFDNGKSAKKLREQTKGAVYHFDPSQNKPIQAKTSNTDPTDQSYLYYNNIYNNISNNTNKQTITNKETKKKDLCQFNLTEENKQETQIWLERLTEEAQRIENLNFELHDRFLKIINSIAEEIEPLKIGGYFHSPDEILLKYLDYFRCPSAEEIEERLALIYGEFDSKVKNQEIDISNDYKYLVAMLYQKTRTL